MHSGCIAATLNGIWWEANAKRGRRWNSYLKWKQNGKVVKSFSLVMQKFKMKTVDWEGIKRSMKSRITKEIHWIKKYSSDVHQWLWGEGTCMDFRGQRGCSVHHSRRVLDLKNLGWGNNPRVFYMTHPKTLNIRFPKSRVALQGTMNTLTHCSRTVQS